MPVPDDLAHRYAMPAHLVAAWAQLGKMPWEGWTEPPVLWAMAIGNPSSNKSPGLDAMLSPLRKVERDLRRDGEAARATWAEAAELAQIAESTWKEAAKRALKEGETAPAKPAEANPGPEPVLPRLAVADAIVERLAVILAEQPRGTLLTLGDIALGVRRSGGMPEITIIKESTTWQTSQPRNSALA